MAAYKRHPTETLDQYRARIKAESREDKRMASGVMFWPAEKKQFITGFENLPPHPIMSQPRKPISTTIRKQINDQQRMSKVPKA